MTKKPSDTTVARDVLRSYKGLKHDSAFRMFVIRHIDEIVPTERLNRIAEHARKWCLGSTKDFCRAIEMAAMKATHAQSGTS